MKTVIIGGVASGAACAARLRRLDEKAEIVLLERGEYISFANCALPYYLSDTVKSRDSLLVQTPAAMKSKYRIDVRTFHEAMSIDRERKTVSILDRRSGEAYEESYDKLVIATGATPSRPRLEGVDSPKIHTLWTIPDADALHEAVGSSRSAAVIGGGFVGMEVVENLRKAGLDVTLILRGSQVMSKLDPEMGALLKETITRNGVNLILNDGPERFETKEDSVSVILKSGRQVDVDTVILSVGTRPNSKLASEAGLNCSAKGFVVTDENMLTSDPDIYAIGDITEVNDIVSGGRTNIALAGPAAKQGRIAADNIAGLPSKYIGAQGTSIAKIFELSSAMTGSSESALKARGLEKGKDYETVLLTQNSHVGFYPGAQAMVIKLIFSMDGSRIYGAQIVGGEGTDKRIDVIAAAIRLGAGVRQLEELELAYAPQFSSAKDPVNMAGFVAGNVISGLVRFSDYYPDADAVLLDVREDAERLAYTIPGAVAMPLATVRDRLSELDPDKEIVVFCGIGVRAYNAARVLMQSGFERVSVYPGGVKVYRTLNEEPAQETGREAENGTERKKEEPPMTEDKAISLDCCGMQCPGPLMKVNDTMRELSEGQCLKVSASDPGFVRDIDAWCRSTGNTLLTTSAENAVYTALLRRGQSAEKSVIEKDTRDGKTIIVFSGDFDKVMASFIIANGAAAMGKEVTMFFTFWGLTALRKQEKQHVEKSFMESMFGAMLPRGVNKLGLSRMNMGGMGTAMMKKIMNDKNVNSLEDLVKKAIAQGVHIMACTMSMDVMGIKPEELIDGVEMAGVGTY
ncbi:MAG: FAD-dependent oxidoreductase, partial [Oscillospiraceae bacterium]|nr:FAD-dependent oxidoreductase [Oscillospiraceae bacterium]